MERSWGESFLIVLAFIDPYRNPFLRTRQSEDERGLGRMRLRRYRAHQDKPNRIHFRKSSCHFLEQTNEAVFGLADNRA
jgi:hypothetical protein